MAGPHPFSPWVSDENAALLTDLYELTMLQAYWLESMNESAVFSLFVRRLPSQRNYLLACGLDDALRYLGRLSFSEEALEFLRRREEFSDPFVDWLRDFRFTGDVYAVLPGTPVFANEPLLEVVAPLGEAQLVESFLMNQIHHQTMVASKASRVAWAAAGRGVVDFGLRRMHGADAGVKAAKACYVAGLSATSNVLAGQLYGVPISGTMAHSYVQAHDDELDAFRSFARHYPEPVLLVDTYDTVEGVEKVIALARELSPLCRVRGIRLDSGDLAELARASRRLLDEAGLKAVEIFVSGGLDELEVERLVASGAPIDGFGVGTAMGVSADAPFLDMVYKLTSYAGVGRIKVSPGKGILPGRKQVFRLSAPGHGRAVKDVLARSDEALPGRPLLQCVMASGVVVEPGLLELEAARRRASEELAVLPVELRALGAAERPYPVEISDALASDELELRRRVGVSSPPGG